MKMLGVLLALILVFACAFSFVVIAQAQNASTGITDATFTDVIMNVGNDATERNITWYSNYNTIGFLQYVKAEDMSGEAFPQEFTSAKARVAKASEKGSYVYKATMVGLEENTEYAYRMVVGDTISEVKFFKVKSFSDDFSFTFVADPQVGSSTAKTQWIDTLSKINTHFGDSSFIVSGGDQIATPTAESDYENFIVDGLSAIAIATTNGPAHDNSALYRDHYNLPNDSSTYGVSVSASDYYYTYNSILFVHINVENDNAEEHIEFLDRAIENNPNTLWQIVVIHHSYFSGSVASTQTNIVNMGKALAGAMNERGVDAVLSGHDHFYARSNLMVDYYTQSTDTVVNNSVENPEGTLYICGTSSSGSGFDSPNNTNNVAYQNASNRKSIVNVSATATSLTFDAYFVDGSMPELFDSFTITRTDFKDPVNVQKYSVTYVTDTDVEHGDDVSDYRTVSYAQGQLPDAPWLVLPAGSFEDGELYEWSWIYKNSDGSVATSFTAGNQYFAYLTYEISKVSDEIYISTTSNPSEGVYTWADAWDLATSFPDVDFKFTLTENMTMTAADALDMVSKTSVTVDLAGYTLNTQSIDYLIKYYIGATDSSFAIISSKSGAKIESKELVRISSNHLSTISVSYGSEESESITAELKYLVYAEGNFKRGSTLNLSVTKGNYMLSEGLIFVVNAADDLSAANHYKVNIKDASITLGNSPVRFSSARKASANSYINATNSDFVMASGTASIVEKDQWYGSFGFYNCNLNGITFGNSAITNISGAIFGSGTVFTNSDATFNNEKTAFSSTKLSLAEGCSLYNSGSAVVVTEGDTDPDNLLRIGNAANHSQNVYTFAEAWEIARANSGVAYIFRLNEDINIITSVIIKNQVKTDVTIDLNGYTFTYENKYYLVSYENGSTGSNLSLISTKSGGKLVADCFVCIGSGAKSVVNVTCGSDDGYPISVDTVHSTYGYLAYMAGNFKNGSTLNLSVKNGTYNFYHGLLFVNNYGTNPNNVYKVDISDSVINIGNAFVGFNGSFRAVQGSYINAVNSTFKASEGTETMLASAQWDGSFEFDNCKFDGIVFDANTLTSISGAVFKGGCTFVNSDASFNSDKSAFASDKLSLDAGCVLNANSDGSVSVSGIPDNVLLISKTANHEAKIYTWNEAWEIAMANPDVAYIFKLIENSNMGGSELLKITAKCNVTLDLAGYRMKVSENSIYLVSYDNSSTGSSFTLISSAPGGSYYGPTIVRAASSGASTLNFTFGSEDSYPITVTTFKSTAGSTGSLTNAVGNFKNGSTLNLKVMNGTYTLAENLLSVSNYSGALNTFKVDISNANITVGTTVVDFASTHNTTANSYFNATNTTFTASSDAVSFFGAAQWYGSLEFDKCTFDAVVFGKEMLVNVSGILFKSGCSFSNSDASFNDNKTSFLSDKISLEEGCILETKDGVVVVIEKALHTHTVGIINGKAPTCTETGLSEGKQCTVCGTIILAQTEVPALGHTEGTPVTENNVAPDCTNVGGYDTVIYCTVCRAELSRVHTDLSALGHIEEILPDKAPTCTETGLSEGKQCTVCGTVTVAQTELPANGHTDADPKDYTCDVCGSDLCTEHVEEKIPAKAPTCTETGLTEGKKCTVCGVITVAQEEIPENGHNYETIVHEPTCVEPGYTTYVCPACGYYYADNTVDANGHTWIDATTEAPKTCQVCGATEGEKLPESTPESTPEPESTVEKNHAQCEAPGIFERIITAIINFFRSLFGLPEICYCGEEL